MKGPRIEHVEQLTPEEVRLHFSDGSQLRLTRTHYDVILDQGKRLAAEALRLIRALK